MKRGWLSRKSCAEYLDVSVRTVDEWRKKGLLPYAKIQGIILIKREWADEAIERHQVKASMDIDTIVNQALRGLK